MTCGPSPVASACWYDASDRWGTAVGFLGIVGDSAHCDTPGRITSHCCGRSQESPMLNPLTGQVVDYPDDLAHALDIDVFGDHDLGLRIVRLALADERLRVRYAIHNRRVYYPDFRGGGSAPGDDHEHHVHLSFTPWSTFDTAPFFGVVIDPPTDPQEDDMVIVRWKDGPAGTPPLKVCGDRALTVRVDQLDSYRAAKIPVVALDGTGAKEEYASYEKLRVP